MNLKVTPCKKAPVKETHTTGSLHGNPYSGPPAGDAPQGTTYTEPHTGTPYSGPPTSDHLQGNPYM